MGEFKLHSKFTVMNIEIKQAKTEQDKKILKDFYLAFLKHLDQYNFEILPTRENSEYVVDNFMWPAALAGDPILIAWVNNQPIGAIFWAECKDLPKTRNKMALEYGIYVAGTFRRKGAGKKLRERAKEILRKKGVKQVVGTVSIKNNASLISQEKAGFNTTGFWQELIL